MSQSQNDTNHSENRRLSFFEVVAQAFSLIFALQNKSGRKRLMDLAETNPLPVLISGITAMAIFFLFCFIASQIVLNLVMG